MGPSEALVEVLAANGVTHVFGIVGSAFMDALDIFPAAGIKFVPVAHEQGAIHMADGYARASGRHGVCIAQNEPGVTKFVTAAAAAAGAATPLAGAGFPVIRAGGGVVMPSGAEAGVALAEALGAPVCSSYLHTDSFPASHPLAVGPLGYQGSKAAMKLIAQADVVLALGTRLRPFVTLPQYGLDYWPK